MKIKKTNLADEDNTVVTHHTAESLEQFIAQEVESCMANGDLEPCYGYPKTITPQIEGNRAWIVWAPGDGCDYTIAEYETE